MPAGKTEYVVFGDQPRVDW